VITLAYVVPVLGFIVYGLVGVMGLGAATVAFTSAYRRENPARPRPAAPAPPVAPPPAPMAMTFSPLPEGESAADAAPRPETSAGADPLSPATLLLFPRAEFVDRLCAFALDVALVLIASGAMDLMDDAGGPILLMLVYHIGFWAWKGTTVGGIICQLRVVRVLGEPIRFIDALVRGLSGLFSIGVLGLGFLWVLKDPERQGWHDRIAGTYVVKVPRNYPLP
jgi:uncharacterized RDD family membrane protein YckC